MRYLIFIIALLGSISVYAQGDLPVKTDGESKYFIRIYDGDTNEKVLFNNTNHAAWATKIQVADVADGSGPQLWSFQATAMYPGYFSVINHDETLPETAFLMSWNWNAYMGSNRDPIDSKEMQYRLVEVTDGWYKFETIEKPADLNSRDYTPGADALNLKPEGFLSFSEVKSADISTQNMVNKVFRFEEFDPLKQFKDDVIRGDKLYDESQSVPQDTRYSFFVVLEKSHELVVFGSDVEILEYHDALKNAIATYTPEANFVNMLAQARAYVMTSDADSETKVSFAGLVDRIEDVYITGAYSNELLENRLLGAQDLVDAIVAGQTFYETLSDLDEDLGIAMSNSIAAAKTTLASAESNADAFNASILHLEKMEDAILEINSAVELYEGTQDFEDAKATLDAAIEEAIVAISNTAVTPLGLDSIIADMQEAIKVFKKALEAGDTLVELLNADFESDLADWNVDSPTPTAAYPENKGVDGSRSITCWKGAEYQMKIYQSLSGMPNGTYTVSCSANVSADNSIALFAESGEKNTVLPLLNEGGLTKRVIEVEVTNGVLEFGIKGNGENNTIPAGNWIVFDEFEVKWASKTSVTNGDFENDLTDWLVEGDVSRAYAENKGVDGSRSITCYSGADYAISVSQTINGLTNGTYAVSAMAKTNSDNAFVVFGESAGAESTILVTGNQLLKFKTVITVTDGTLIIGVKGAGENNAVPAGNWIVFDNVEVVRMPEINIVNAGFEDELNGWTIDATAGVPYVENKGVDGSRSVTYWKGAEYYASTYQTISSLQNGTYEITAMTKAQMDDLFELFGESDGIEFTSMLKATGSLETSSVMADVTDGSLRIGIRGAGDGNTIPSGRWIVFDEFALKLKSIVPQYETVTPQAQEFIPEVVEQFIPEGEPKIIYSPNSQSLDIESSDVIISYSVYSLTGALIDNQKTRRNSVSIPLNRGMYIVRITTENGVVDTAKISIH